MPLSIDETDELRDVRDDGGGEFSIMNLFSVAYKSSTTSESKLQL